jgi:hypothetical protein
MQATYTVNRVVASCRPLAPRYVAHQPCRQVGWPATGTCRIPLGHSVPGTNGNLKAPSLCSKVFCTAEATETECKRGTHINRAFMFKRIMHVTHSKRRNSSADIGTACQVLSICTGEEEETVELEIKVEGMVCGGCSSRVEEALKVSLVPQGGPWSALCTQFPPMLVLPIISWWPIHIRTGLKQELQIHV